MQGLFFLFTTALRLRRAMYLARVGWFKNYPCPKHGGYAAVLALAGRKARRSRGAKHGAKRTLEDSGDAHAAQRPNYTYKLLTMNYNLLIFGHRGEQYARQM